MSAIQQAMMAVPPAGPSVTYATWDPSKKTPGVVLSGGNLSAQLTGAGTGTSGNTTVVANMTKTTGKWYWEVKLSAGPGVYVDIGISNNSFDWLNESPGRDVAGNSAGYYSADGYIYASNVGVTAGASYTIGDTISIALDAGASTVQIRRNNTLQYSGSIPTDSWGPAVGTVFGFYGENETLLANFGATPFTYSPPAGYNAGLYL